MAAQGLNPSYQVFLKLPRYAYSCPSVPMDSRRCDGGAAPEGQIILQCPPPQVRVPGPIMFQHPAGGPNHVDDKKRQNYQKLKNPLALRICGVILLAPRICEEPVGSTVLGLKDTSGNPEIIEMRRFGLSHKQIEKLQVANGLE